MAARHHRRELTEWLIEQLHCPYVYGAKGNVFRMGEKEVTAYDCSGLVTCGMVTVGWPETCPRCGLSWKEMHNAQRLWDELEPVPEDEKPRPLDLCFYGKDARKVEHVMFLWLDGRVLGACGGNRATLDPMDALMKGAKVRTQREPKYREDFLGFRKLPL